MPEKPTLKESGIRLLMAAVLATVAVGIVYNIIQQVIALPGMPYNVRELFPESHRTVRIAAFSVAIVWMGLGPVWVGDFLSGRPRFIPFLPIWSVMIGLVTWSLLRFSVTHESLGDILGRPTLGWSGDWEFIGRFIALQASASLTLIMTSIAVAAIVKQDWREGSKRGLYGLLLGTPWVVLAWTIVVGWANTDNLTELIRATPNHWTGPLFLTGLLGLISLNTSMLCYAWMYRPSLEKVLALLVTPLFVIAGFGLLWLGLDPAVEKYGTTFPAARFLLGPDRETFMSMTELAVRWGAVQISAVAVLAIGGFIALCLRPRIKSDITPPLNSDHKIEHQSSQNVQSRWRRFYFTSTMIYAAFLLYGSMIPLNFHAVPFNEAVSEFRAQLHLNQNHWSRSDIITNLAMYIPLIYCALGACSNPSRRFQWVWMVPLIFVCGVSFSFLLEFSQIYLPGRTVSSSDLIAQTIGNLFGIAAWFAFGIPLTLWLDGLFTEQDQKLRTKLLYFYITLFVLYSILPLDFTISIGQIWQKYKAGMINFIPFSDVGEMDLLIVVLKIAFYFPIGFLFTTIFSRSSRQPLIVSVISTLVFATLVAGIQMLILSRYATITDVFLGTIGAILGTFACMLTGPTSEGQGVHSDWWKRWGVLLKVPALIAWLFIMVHDRWNVFNLQISTEELIAKLELCLSQPFGYWVYSAGPMYAVFRLTQEFVTSMVLGLMLQSLFVSFHIRKIHSSIVGIAIILTIELGRLQFTNNLSDSLIFFTAITGVITSLWAYPRLIKLFLTPDNVSSTQDEERACPNQFN